MSKVIDLKSPIFSIYIIEDKIIVACGGGAAKFGVKNKLSLYKIESGLISDIIYQEELGEVIPEYIEGVPRKKIFGYCGGNKIIFYSLTKDGKKFLKLYTLDILPEKTQINCFKINDSLLAAGSEAGSLKLFKVDFLEDSINKIWELSSNEDAHWKSINKIDFIIRKSLKFLVTASGDGTCKIFDIPSKETTQPIKMISKISFRESLSEPANYFMRDIICLNDSFTIYTLQSPLSGRSFLTKWDSRNVNNIKPIKTIKVSDVPCPVFSLTKNRKYFGLTDSNGKIIFVNVQNMSIAGEKKIGEGMMKNCIFYQNYFITGSIDYKLTINKLISGTNTKIFSIMFYFSLILGALYYIYLKKNNLVNDE